MNSVLWPLLTAVLGSYFSVLLIRQFQERRKPHQWLWAFGFALYAFAAFGEFYSEVWGWTTVLYKLYYVSAASLVAFLGAGTVFLLFSRKAAWTFLIFVSAVSLAMLLTAWQSPVNTSAFLPGKIVAGQAMASKVRIFSPILTIPGSLALLGGALYSWIKGRAAYNLMIVAGTLVIASAGGLSRFGLSGILYLGEIAGLILLFGGFLGSRQTMRPSPRHTNNRGESGN